MEAVLIIGGVVVSLIVQYTKKKLNLNVGGIMILVVILSLIGAGVSQTLSYYGWMDAFLQFMTSAGAFYAFILNNIEKSTNLPKE